MRGIQGDAVPVPRSSCRQARDGHGSNDTHRRFKHCTFGSASQRINLSFNKLTGVGPNSRPSSQGARRSREEYKELVREGAKDKGNLSYVELV